MDYLPLEISSVSAEGLKKVNVFSKMDVYVSVSISGVPCQPQFTPIDKRGGSNPNWNQCSLNFSLAESAIKQQNLSLIFVLKSRRILGDREIGRVYVPLRELLGDPSEKGSSQVSYQVRTPSGKARGMLTFSYKLGKKIPMAPPANWTASEVHAPGKDDPVMAYPPPAGGVYYAPPQYGYPPGYGYPPLGGYGYTPPRPVGYGYGAPPPRKSRMGMGMGLGAGLLGGLLLGDMVSDMGEAAYDSGYDAAIDDVGFGF